MNVNTAIAVIQMIEIIDSIPKVSDVELLIQLREDMLKFKAELEQRLEKKVPIDSLLGEVMERLDQAVIKQIGLLEKQSKKEDLCLIEISAFVLQAESLEELYTLVATNGTCKQMQEAKQAFWCHIPRDARFDIKSICPIGMSSVLASKGEPVSKDKEMFWLHYRDRVLAITEARPCHFLVVPLDLIPATIKESMKEHKRLMQN